MGYSRVNTQAVAIIILVLHLFLTPFAHAHGLALVKPDRPHASDVVCLVVDDGASHDSTANHHHDTDICHLDIPFVVTRIQIHSVKPVITELSSSYAGRLLPGHPMPLYVPPRESA